jgi:Pretoxin HINT domain/Hint domain
MNHSSQHPKLTPLLAVLRVLLSVSTTVSGMNLPPRETPVLQKNRVWEIFPAPAETHLENPAGTQQLQWEIAASFTKPASGVLLYANGNPAMMNDPSGNFSILLFVTAILQATVEGTIAAGAAASEAQAQILDAAYKGEIDPRDISAAMNQAVNQSASMAFGLGFGMGGITGLLSGSGIAAPLWAQVGGAAVGAGGLLYHLDDVASEFGSGNYLTAQVKALNFVSGVGVGIGLGLFTGKVIGRSIARSYCFVAGTEITTAHGEKPIESLQLGDRVLTPSGDCSTEVDPATWKKITLQLPTSAPSLDVLDIELLRPEDWMVANNCTPGAQIWLDLEEMGIHGLATVQSVEDCPSIQSGKGRVVLATFTRSNVQVMDLKLEGQEKVLNPTHRHPMFSATRNDWVETEQLQIGETLVTQAGEIRVESLKSKVDTYRVYNIEVESEHCYYVGKSKVLSHNACALRPEGGYLSTKKHGIFWKEGSATAKSLGKSQGQWGSKADLDFAAGKAATLKP